MALDAFKTIRYGVRDWYPSGMYLFARIEMEFDRFAEATEPLGVKPDFPPGIAIPTIDSRVLELCAPFDRGPSAAGGSVVPDGFVSVELAALRNGDALGASFFHSPSLARSPIPPHISTIPKDQLYEQHLCAFQKSIGGWQRRSIQGPHHRLRRLATDRRTRTRCSYPSHRPRSRLRGR